MAAYRAIRAFVAMVIFGSGLAPGRAADIQASSEKLCAFKLEGTITSGDYDRIANCIY